MSDLVCPNLTSAKNLGYPPVKPTSADLAAEAKTAELAAQAPFGRSSKGVAINSAQYTTAMNRQMAAVKAVDFKWPFWVGIGIGGLGFVVLLAKR